MFVVRNSPIVLMLLLCTALIAQTARAQKKDAPAQTITIEADRMQYNDKNQTNVFSGNVVLVRGGLEIRSQKLELRKDKAGNQFATARGKPATFKSKDPARPDTVEGSGQELRYTDQTQVLEILNGATLRRITAGNVSDEVHGAKIVYQGDKDFFTVEGGSGGKSSANPRGRVRVVIQPRSASGNGKAAPTSLKPSKSLAK